MHRSIFIAIVSILGMAASGEEKPPSAVRIATVEMQELFKQYHRTQAAEKEMSGDRARLQKDGNERLAHSKELEANLEKLHKQLEDPAINESKKQTLYKEWQAGQQEAIATEREQREFVQRRTRALNEKMIQRMRGILEEIRVIVEEQAKVDGFDYVFDRSGLSSSQVPILIYAKDSTDITAILLKRINRDAPSAESSVTKTAAGDTLKPGTDP